MLDKFFNPQAVENRLYQKTEPFFACDKTVNRETYTIMMPPPNVTGSLHLGHALNDTLQDILIRYYRKKGKDVLWQPGTDHAGIATQIVVERQLAEEGLTRHDLGRDAFIDKVWEWKEKSGNTIVNQKRRLCISPDWERARFTMDEGLSRAVVKVFVQLHQEGLIYRAKRLVNWDTALQTAISDLEVETREQKGHMWHINYKVQGTDTFITVATTRPETLFGDTAVAVHPEDERYQHLIGKMVHLPLTDRLIPIIADTYCDKEKGTGAVKITPGHDMNDFAVGQRNKLPLINIMDSKGLLIDPVPSEYVGLTFPKARAKVLAALEAQELLVKIEPITNQVPYSERSNVEVQPWLTDQWFIDAETLAAPALKAVEDGRTEFFPKNWENTYFEWMRNIQPWCISRQIWWGHQIPAWHAKDGRIFVAESQEEAQKQAGSGVELTRDPDVLDTWFSSALWPFSTLGWPDKTPELDRYYPTELLTTGFDIIFFWVARMMMMGMHFMGEVPFKTVYIHALVRDEKGQKMSKSKGNIIDPLVLIDKFGADALRFTLAQLAAPGRDVKIGEARVESCRNFITKIWNAARFLEMNECTYDPAFDPAAAKSPVNQWIIKKTVEMINDVSREIEGYRFDLAAGALYHFLWGAYCDIYVECLKPLLTEPQIADETRKTAMWVLVQFLKASNPIMPMVTEHLWEEFVGADQPTLMEQSWPELSIPCSDAIKGVDWAVTFVQEVRSLKGLLGISGAIRVPLISQGSEKDNVLLTQHWAWISHLARLSDLENDGKGVPFVVSGSTFVLAINDVIHTDDVKKVLQNKHDTLSTEVAHLSKKLTNEAFKNAKPDVWQVDFDLHALKTIEVAKIQGILAAL
ncbi:MAG: valine--tRNA ligase [Candidatus Paracaedibacteraceae bacterium]|nr:valine--tRNA ligase [Candidatus Paracaedibacteraceae bacterium]